MYRSYGLFQFVYETNNHGGSVDRDIGLVGLLETHQEKKETDHTKYSHTPNTPHIGNGGAHKIGCVGSI